MLKLLYPIILTFHIISGTVCLITGIVAMRSSKRKGSHTNFGEVYHGSYVIVAISAIIMAVMHWTHSAYLFYIAIFSYGLALIEYLARKIKWTNWLGSHIGGMLGSYIGIVTATLVVNVPNIPLLNQIPVLIFWFLPTIIGTPLILRVGSKYGKKHVNRVKNF